METERFTLGKPKRSRKTYDSCGLCRKGRFIDLRAWTSSKFYRHLQKREIEDTLMGLPSRERIDGELLKVWLENYANELQDIRLSVSPPLRTDLFWLFVFDETE